jgi:hypothetical protein
MEGERQKEKGGASLHFYLLPFYFCLPCPPSLTVGLPPVLSRHTFYRARRSERKQKRAGGPGFATPRTPVSSKSVNRGLLSRG